MEESEQELTGPGGEGSVESTPEDLHDPIDVGPGFPQDEDLIDNTILAPEEVSLKSKDTLKSYFERGDIPTELQFSDLINAFRHISDGHTIADVTTEINGSIHITLSDGTTITISPPISDDFVPKTGGDFEGKVTAPQMDITDTLEVKGDIIGRNIDGGPPSKLLKFEGLYLGHISTPSSFGTDINHSIRSRYGNEWKNKDSITINSANHIRLNIDSNNNQQSRFEIGGGTSGIDNVIFSVDEFGNTNSKGYISIGERRVATEQWVNTQGFFKGAPDNFISKNGGVFSGSVGIGGPATDKALHTYGSQIRIETPHGYGSLGAETPDAFHFETNLPLIWLGSNVRSYGNIGVLGKNTFMRFSDGAILENNQRVATQNWINEQDFIKDDVVTPFVRKGVNENNAFNGDYLIFNYNTVSDVDAISFNPNTNGFYFNAARGKNKTHANASIYVNKVIAFNDLSTAKSVHAAGNMYAGAGSGKGSYYGGDKEIIKFSDGWLRLNPSTTSASRFNSGIYCSTSKLRTDGQFEIGSEGSKFKVTSGGTVTASGNFSTSGNDKGYRFYNSDKFKIYMTTTANGGRVNGETTSDFNMYFKILNNGGVNRGFIFKTESGNVAGIDGAGNGRFKGRIIAFDNISTATNLNAGGDINANQNIRGRIASGVASKLVKFEGLYFGWVPGTTDFGSKKEHCIRSSYGDETTDRDSITINSYNHIRLNIDSNNNNVSKFEIGGGTTGIGNVLFSVNENGETRSSGNIYANGSAYFGDGKEIIRFTDSWLRLNPRTDLLGFTSGIYCGHSILRTDGQLEVGSGGSKFKVTSSGTVTAAGNITGMSDRKLKEAIQPVKESVLDKIDQLKPIYYHWKDKAKDQARQLGFIAQDVKEVFPEWVHENEEYYSMSYDKMGAVLAVKGIQELHEEIKSLRKELKILKDSIIK